MGVEGSEILVGLASWHGLQFPDILVGFAMLGFIESAAAQE